MKRLTLLLLPLLLGAGQVPAPTTQAITDSVKAALNQAHIAADVQVNVAGYDPFTIQAVPQVLPTASATNAHINLNNNSSFIGDPLHKPTIQGAGNGASIFSLNPTSSNIRIAHVILDSVGGTGIACNLHGSNITIEDVDLLNFTDALTVQGVTNLTLIGGSQKGNVTGRCIFPNNWKGGTWTGGSYGPSRNQSPIRFSSDANDPNLGGVVGVTIKGVTSTQHNSQFPIATWAIHRAINVTWIDCVAIEGEFSFDSAGEGKADLVTGCTIQNLKTVATKFNIGAVANNCKIVGGDLDNPTGECISLSCGSGVTIDGATLHSTKRGIKFYAPSNCVVKNCRLYAPKGTPIIDGGTPANDGGGNVLIVTP